MRKIVAHYIHINIGYYTKWVYY